MGNGNVRQVPNASAFDYLKYCMASLKANSIQNEFKKKTLYAWFGYSSRQF